MTDDAAYWKRAVEVEKAASPIFAAAMAVSVADAAFMVDSLERKDAMLPFVDPTAYLRGAGDVSGVALRMARAFLQFRAELERIAEAAGPEFVRKWARTAARAEALRAEAEGEPR